MAVDYAAIANDQQRLQRTATNSIKTLSGLYAERSHFVLELLQNAEDALRKRPTEWQDPKTVTFRLSPRQLRVSHFGKPFDHDDVERICSVGDSGKELTDIGRFGIGFKSVYAFTDRPEVHSGSEDFAIEDYVSPVGASPIRRQGHETVILIPLRAGDDLGEQEIAQGLERLAAQSLLFLRQIDEIRWSIDGGKSGVYVRDSAVLGPWVRKVTVIGQEEGAEEVDETWLVFSREVRTTNNQFAGFVEIAFAMDPVEPEERIRVHRVPASPLVVFFPTVLETHLGFLAQGPYRTTPSRENVPPNDQWNQHCLKETAALLIDALHWMRDRGILDTAALRCLPLDRSRFSQGSMFAPIFDASKRALGAEPLLPRDIGGFASSSAARLGRTQDIRDLFNGEQLAAILGAGSSELAWLTGEISINRTPELRTFLINELGVVELSPDQLIPKLSTSFLDAQSDKWIVRLYEFLAAQPGLISRIRTQEIPIVRLENGRHVPTISNGQPAAFLPTTVKTGYPTVRQSVCESTKAVEFLKAIGLSEPELVDDIIRNLLPKYMGSEVDVDGEEYPSDIARILGAFGTENRTQRERLIAALKQASFILSVDSGDGKQRLSKPADVYLATPRFREMFAGVPGVMLVDDSCGCLAVKEISDLLGACGARDTLVKESTSCDLSPGQLSDLRQSASGSRRVTQAYDIEDHTLRGLPQLLNRLPHLTPEDRKRRSGLLWEALKQVERQSAGVFSATYRWRYYSDRSAPFEPAFIRMLNESAWVPDAEGNLHPPEAVDFDSLGWESNPFIQSKIRFKPPLISVLAELTGLDPAMLVRLKKLGISSVAELESRLGLKPETNFESTNEAPGGNVGEALKDLLGNGHQPTPPAPDPLGPEPTGSGGGGSRPHGGGSARESHGAGPGGHGSTKRGTGGGARGAGSAGGRPFISYLGVHPTDGEERDADGLNYEARMALEEKAIALILSYEGNLIRTKTHNPGFDLFEPGPNGQPLRWVEVKAMTGCLHDRPVGMSRPQFECAREHGEYYWLYVVEHASTPNARIVRIQDPAGKAQTFTFDHGWSSIAEFTPDDADEPEEETT